ncbi:MAG: TRAP transporter substrate-binding protein DctP [Pseudomonadota bacterium]
MNLQSLSLRLAFGGSLCCAVTGTAIAQGFEWDFNNNYAIARDETGYLEAWADDIRESSGGRLDITVHSGGSMGLADADVLQWLGGGAVESGFVYANFLGRDAPALQLALTQGVVGSQEELAMAVPELQEIFEEALPPFNIQIVGYMGLPPLGVAIFCQDDAVDTLDELREKRLRVWAADQVSTFEQLGVAAEIIPQEEIYVALTTGVVDCALYPPRLAHTVSLQEATDYAAYLYPVAAIPYVISVNQDAWNALPEDLQQIVIEATDRLWERSSDYSDAAAQDQAAVDGLGEQGVEWLGNFSDEDRRAFADAAAVVWETRVDEVGAPAPEYRQRILEALGR